MKIHMIERPGSTLYCEVRGTGPALIFLPGGPQDAGIFADIATVMATDRVVITFDPRGNSRSPIVDMAADLDVQIHAADVAALIETLGQGVADVFGTSGGAQVAMALATRHPERMRSLVLHEAPTVHILSDPSAAIAADRAIVDVYREHGVEAGIGAFFGMAEMDGFGDGDGGADVGSDGPPMMDEEAVATMERVMANFEYFLGHGMVPLSLYQPDLDTLKASGIPITIGVGATSSQSTMQEISERLADELGAPLVTFPGDHSGFAMEPEDFARVLQEILAH